MDDNVENVGLMNRIPALAESEDMESVGTDFDDADDVDGESSLPVVDRYGFSGGQQYTDPSKEYLPPIDVLRSREMKWLEMCRNWDYWSTSGIKKLRERCRKGIPDSMRGEAWQRLIGSATTKFQQIKAFVAEPPIEQPPPGVSPLRKLFGSSARLSGSRSLPTVVTNSPSTGRSRVLESSHSKPPLPPSSLPPLLPHPASIRQQNEAISLSPQDSLARRRRGKSGSNSSQFMSFRKFSSLFRLNSTSTTGAITNPTSAQPPSNSTDDPSDETDAATFYQRGEIITSGHRQDVNRSESNERSRTYSVALPSAAYLGISIGTGEGANGKGFVSGVGHQPSDSTTTTTSTGVSTDAYSTSSNFFSAAESSAENLRVFSGAPDSSLLNSPALALHNHRRLFATDNGGGGLEDEASPVSSHFSTLSSSHRSSIDGIDIDVDRESSSPQLSLSLGMRGEHQQRLAVASAKDREATLVAPNSTTGDQVFDPYVQYEVYAAQEGDPATCEQIGKDIHRQFPFHELFCSKNSGGRESLFKILKAYTIRHPSKGYCQGQAPLAAVLLMFMPEEDAFWTFTEICERYLVSYYDEGLELIQIDGQILYGLLKRLFPHIYKFLVKHGAEPIMLVVEWFMCVYTRTLPWCSALRVLDMFFCEGKIIIFKVGLLLLYRCFNSSTFRKQCGGIDEILMQAQTIPSQLDNPEELVHNILQIKIDRRQVAKEVMKQSQRWRARMSTVPEK
nr:TBC1 domain family 0B [Hymenolepis microstoma]